MGLKSKTKYLLKQFPFIYPRRVIDSCEEWIAEQGRKKGAYFSQRGPWAKTIFPEAFIQNSAPQTVGEPNEKAFYNNRNYPTHRASLFYLQNCYLFGHKGLILSAKNEVFQEFSHHFGITTLKKFLLKNPFYIFSNDIKKIPGISIVLVSPESNNYYHWLSDVLPRIKLYEQVLDQADHFCVASNVPAKFLEVLKDFGIPKEKILLVNEKDKLHFDYLYVSSLPGSEGRSPHWAVDYVREKLIKSTNTQLPSKKIYFKRGDAAERKIVNEKSLIALLQHSGFEIIEPGELTILEQIELMQQAKIVVAAHGAALGNLLFSRDKTAVIELFSPDYFRTDCYYTLSSILKLNYWYAAGEKPVGANWGDIVVNEELLLKTITQTNGN
jgi:capsular polysaccharide biosynthesis protein